MFLKYYNINILGLKDFIKYSKLYIYIYIYPDKFHFVSFIFRIFLPFSAIMVRFSSRKPSAIPPFQLHFIQLGRPTPWANFPVWQRTLRDQVGGWR